MTRRQRESREILSGQLTSPGERPKSIQLVLNNLKEQDEVVTVTATTYTIEGKKYILVDDDTAGAAVTITLPPAIDSTDRVIIVKKIGSTATVTIDGNASETIDGSTTAVISTQYTALQLVSDGANWFVV